jgi:hypothetical protein
VAFDLEDIDYRRILMTDATALLIRKGASQSTDEVTAVRELAAAIKQPDMALGIFYCSSAYDLVKLEAALAAEFGDAPLIGCTTAGEISPFGYFNGTLAGVSIGSNGLRAESIAIDLSPFQISEGEASADKLLAKLAASGRTPTTTNTFGFLLVDGLSMQEEIVVSCIHSRLHGIQLIGGSAGDDVKFGATHIYHGGKFHRNIALMTLVQTDFPFYVFRTQHFVESDCKMVVTGADPANRIVHEINGEPAGREFARAVGLEVAELTPLIFAAHPVVVKIGGDYFVRSIQKVNPDGSLTFFCAIDEGLVLTVARGVDMIESLDAAFTDVRARVGVPQLVLGCDCILRRLELEQRNIKEAAGKIMADNNVVGFATYGEQFNAMHVNQTFTGVAIGSRAR